MNKYLLVISILLSLPQNLLAQNTKKVDSLIKVYKTKPKDSSKVKLINSIVQIQLYNDPEQAKSFIKEMISLSKEINYIKGEAQGYYRLAGYYYNQDKIDSALVNYKTSSGLHKSINNIIGVVSSNAQLGLAYGRKKEFDSALFYLNENIKLYSNSDQNNESVRSSFKFIGSTFHTLADTYIMMGSFNLALKEELNALYHYEKMGDSLYIADAKNSLASIENALGNHQKGLEYINAALKTYEDNKDVFFQTLAIINKGVSLQGLKRYEESIKNYKQGILIANSNNYKGREALLWSNMGNSYFELTNYDKAKESYWKSVSLYKSTNYNLEISSCYNNLGKLYNKTKQLDSALYYLNNAIIIADTTNAPSVLGNGYKHRSETYKQLKNYKQSLTDYENYSKLKDSLFTKEKVKQIEELRTIHETEKKAQKIQIQKNEIDLLTTKGKINNLQRLLLGLGLFLALLGLYIFYQRNKQNKLLNEKVKADLEHKTKELTTHALHLAKKNEVLNDLKTKAKAFKEDSNSNKGFQTLIQTINFDLQDDNNWENFSKYFEEVHKGFNKKAKEKFPNITPNDLRLMALLKMNLTSKEMANILNISNEGIKKARQRLRKKMGLSTNDSLEAVVITI